MLTRGSAALFVVLVAGATAPAAPPDEKGPQIERRPDFVQRVNDAIDRGVAWMKQEQADDGSWEDYPAFPGATTALGYVTLKACGLAKDDKNVKAAWTSLRQTYRMQDLRVYSAAVYLMAIAEHGERATAAKDERDVKLTKDESKWAEEIVRFLAAAQDNDGRWSYEGSAHAVHRGEELPNEWDNSNTQYALLGLKSAARCGIAIDTEVWRKSLRHFIDVQEASGPAVPRGTGPRANVGTSAPIVDHARGWNYRERPDAPVKRADGVLVSMKPPYSSMTAGGISSLVICRSELLGTKEMSAKLDTDSERGIWDGLAWLGTNWMPTGLLKPGNDLAPKFRDAMGEGLSMYEFYGVERAGVLAGVDWMAGMDWYGAGAASLVDVQQKDGSWTGCDPGLMVDDLAQRKRAFRPVDTCFALLFLRRGTVPVTRGAVTSGGDESDINFAAASKLAGKDLEDFLDLVFGRWRRAQDANVRTRLFDGATSVGPSIVEPLVMRLDSTDSLRRDAANALLSHATGLDFGYDAGGSAAARDAAVVKWQMWWMTSQGRVVYDPGTKRLVAR